MIFKGYFQSGHIVRAHLGTPSCTSQDWLTYHLPCKHFYAIFKLKTEWSWDKLPKEYVNSPRLSYDKDVLHSALVADESAHITEQSSVFDYEETIAGLEDSFPSYERTKQVWYITAYTHAHFTCMIFNITLCRWHKAVIATVHALWEEFKLHCTTLNQPHMQLMMPQNLKHFFKGWPSQSLDIARTQMGIHSLFSP